MKIATCVFDGCSNLAVYKTGKQRVTHCKVHKFMNQKCIIKVKKNDKVFCFVSATFIRNQILDKVIGN